MHSLHDGVRPVSWSLVLSLLAALREAAVVLRLMLSAGFLDNMERESEMDIEAGIFEEGMPLPARTECMGFFVDRLEVDECGDLFVAALLEIFLCYSKNSSVARTHLPQGGRMP